MIEFDFSNIAPDNDAKFTNPKIIVQGEGELKFKLAACKLVFTGIYPSGRQILKELSRAGRLMGKPNLNGRECQWKDDIFDIFSIKPYYGYANKIYREDLEGLSDRTFLYERGPKGTLVKINDRT